MLEPAKRHAAELALPGVYAEFATDDEAVAAAERLVAAGYVVVDAFTPRAVEALERIVAPERSNLNRTVFVAGFCGALTGLGIQWACNAWDYPLNVGGRPPFALPAYVPITFEAMVLFAAFAAFFGFMHRAGLPFLSHPVFEVPGFERASIDRFFLLVRRPGTPAADDELRTVLSQAGAVSVFVPPAVRARTQTSVLAPEPLSTEEPAE